MAGASSQPARPRSIWLRKMDMLYIFFLSSNIIFPMLLDFIPLYPIALPSWFKALHEFYSTEYNDPLCARNPPFFQLYVWIEVFYLVPMSLYCIRGLLKETPMTPIHLLVYSTHMISSTFVCLVEVAFDRDASRELIVKNLPGYSVFLILAVVMWIDMFGRVKGAVMGKMKLG